MRIRDAVQYAATIDEFVERLNKGNNGGYANAWLIADHNTGEIAASSRAWNSRASSAPSTARTSAATPCSTRASATWNARTTAQRSAPADPAPVAQRWMELIDQYYGKIDLEVVKKMLADTYDVYLGYNCPSSRDICSHYDVDPQYYADDPDAVWNIPFYPAGSCDAKAAGPDDVKHLKMWGRYGRADGVEFNARDFMDQHPLWKWMDGYLEDRPTQPWTLFD